METIGDAYHVHGPLVVGPEAVATALVKSFAKARAPLAALRKAELEALVGPRFATLFGAQVLLLPSGTPTTVLPSADGVVLVRSSTPPRSRKGESYVAKEHLGALAVTGPLVLFDSVAGADLDWSGSESARRRFLAKRAARRLALPLEPGTYDVCFSAPAPAAAGPQVVRLARVGALAQPKRRR